MGEIEKLHSSGDCHKADTTLFFSFPFSTGQESFNHAHDKDHGKFIRHLLKMADRFIFPHVDFGRAESGSGGCDPETLKALVGKYSPEAVARVSPCMEDALDQAFRLAAGRPVMVTGSFHPVGEAMRILKVKA